MGRTPHFSLGIGANVVGLPNDANSHLTEPEDDALTLCGRVVAVIAEPAGRLPCCARCKNRFKNSVLEALDEVKFLDIRWR